MKTIQIDKKTFEYNLDIANWFDDDCTCFARTISGRLYLYSENGDGRYFLDVFDSSLEELLCDSKFVAKLVNEKIDKDPDNICDFCKFIGDCMVGNFDYNKMPFELHDIVYSL